MGIISNWLNDGKVQPAYDRGFEDGENGNPRKHNTIVGRHTDEWIEAYDRGYEDGRKERMIQKGIYPGN